MSVFVYMNASLWVFYVNMHVFTCVFLCLHFAVEG